MTAKEFLKSDECPDIKSGFGLSDVQMSVLAVIMQEYTNKQLLLHGVVGRSEQLPSCNKCGYYIHPENKTCLREGCENY